MRGTVLDGEDQGLSEYFSHVNSAVFLLGGGRCAFVCVCLDKTEGGSVDQSGCVGNEEMA